MQSRPESSLTFLVVNKISCCLKMKSVEKILGYIREQFYRFSRGCKPRENLWNFSRKYLKIFETYFIFRQQKIEFKPMSGVIMLLCNRMFCCIFGLFGRFGPNMGWKNNGPYVGELVEGGPNVIDMHILVWFDQYKFNVQGVSYWNIRF